MAWTVSNSERDFVRGRGARWAASVRWRAFHSVPDAARRKPLANRADLDDNRLMHPSVSSSRAQRGFTLLELMVACAVLLIMAALAASPLRDAFMNVRLSSAAN